MAEVLKKFGRYFLLDHIAQGGMAEIYRARMAAADGAGRIMVIKRIQAGFGANNEFVQMFKAEIKVTMGFNHPNIVQLYDYGEEQGQPYIAMELVDGKNLRQFSTRFNELKQSFPVDLAAYVVEQASAGLHYAHSFKDKISGEPLHLVHRDISPQNIMVSFEGNVKVIDFGIAKVATASEATRAGVIKGKPSYLSPEQISGDPLDGRCDVFALGIVLWELLIGRKLFAGENDLAVLKQIEAVQTHAKPPSTLRADVPKELDYIVLKALAKQRDKRYQSGEELQRALHKFLYQFNPEFNPSDVSYYAKDLFKNEIVEDRKRIQKLNEKVEQLLQIVSDAPDVDANPAAPKKREDTTTVVDANPKRSGANREVSLEVGNRVEMDRTPVRRARSVPVQPKKEQSSKGSGTFGGSETRSGLVRPSPSQLTQDPRRSSGGAGGGVGKILVAAAAAAGGVVLFGPQFGFDPLNLKGGSAPTADRGPGSQTKPIPKISTSAGQQVSLQHQAQGASSSVTDIAGAARAVVLRMNVTPGGGGFSTVTLNGKAIEPTSPVRVPIDAPLELVIERSGFRSFRRDFVISSAQVGSLKEYLMDVPLEPEKFGTLTIRTTPSADAMIMLDGKPWVKKTPFEAEKLPIGTYNIRLMNEVLGMEKIVTVSIAEGKAVSIDETLEIKNGGSERAPGSQ